MPHPIHERDDDGAMPFGEHLEELRRRLLLALALPLPLAIIAFFLSDTLIRWLLLPLYDVLEALDLPLRVQVLGPAEYIIAQVKLSVIAALIVSAPWILWQVWLFVRPGLFAHERRFVRFLLPGSAVLTVAGVALMYFVMLPFMLLVLAGFARSAELPQPNASMPDEIAQVLQSVDAIELRAQPPTDPQPGQVWMQWPQMRLYAALPGEEDARADDTAATADAVADRPPPGRADPVIVYVPPPPAPAIEQVYRLSTYLDFALLMLLAITIAFQMPLVIVLLGWLDLASADWLAANRRYALLVCAVVAAIITPADIASMLIMLLPLYGLYELGVLLLRLAPASAVAEGRPPWRRRGDRAATARTDKGGERPHKAPSDTENLIRPVQPERSVPREDGKPHPPDQSSDEAEGEGR